MSAQKDQILKALLATAREMPIEKLREVSDFADFLAIRQGRQAEAEPPRPERGSPAALLRHAGTLRFEDGELERLLCDLEDQRMLDMETAA